MKPSDAKKGENDDTSSENDVYGDDDDGKTISVDDDGVEVGRANTRDDHDDHDYG